METQRKETKMIWFDNNNENEYLMFFAGDGSYGEASDIVVVDYRTVSEHCIEFVEFVSDWDRPAFMRWAMLNDTHEPTAENGAECEVCERWADGTEDEILAEMEN